jgi:response regulator of citrate/malate metabolism
MVKVLIVEDDPMVASIDSRYVEMDGRFQVLKVFDNGRSALEYREMDQVDLIILDYFMPSMNGTEFLDALHGRGYFPSIIMVTSANDTDTVTALISRGVVDYLVKPFEYSRFQEALSRFIDTRGLLSAHSGQVAQEDIDRLLHGARPKASGQKEVLAKGLNAPTLERIRGFLRGHAGQSFTSESIAQAVGLSRITVRRYVNYMVDTGELVSNIDYHTGGRPGIHYRYSS